MHSVASRSPTSMRKSQGSTAILVLGCIAVICSQTSLKISVFSALGKCVTRNSCSCLTGSISAAKTHGRPFNKSTIASNNATVDIVFVTMNSSLNNVLIWSSLILGFTPTRATRFDPSRTCHAWRYIRVTFILFHLHRYHTWSTAFKAQSDQSLIGSIPSTFTTGMFSVWRRDSSILAKVPIKSSLFILRFQSRAPT